PFDPFSPLRPFGLGTLVPDLYGRNASSGRRSVAVMMTVGETTRPHRVRQGGRAMAAKPIVAGTDGSEESLRAVGWAARGGALRAAPLRIVSAEESPPGMITRAGPGEQKRVTDVLLGERDQALVAAAERAAKTAHGVLIDTDSVTGSVDEAVTGAG